MTNAITISNVVECDIFTFNVDVPNGIGSGSE